MRFRIDLKIFLIAIIYFFTNQIQIYVLMMIFALIHEFGHLIAGILLKMKPKKLEIILTGVSISFKTDIKDINKKIGKGNMLNIKKLIVAIAGPLTNILIIAIVLKMPLNMIKQLNIIYANLVILIFNLIPIYPLDGGRIIKELLNIKFGRKKSIRYMDILSILDTIILSIIGVMITMLNNNIAIIIIILYIWILVLKEHKITKQKVVMYKSLEKFTYWNLACKYSRDVNTNIP